MLLWGFINSAYYWTNKSMGHGNFRGWKPANQLARGNGCNGTSHSERSVQMVLSICCIYLTHYSTNISWQETSIVAKAGVRSCWRIYLDDSWSQAWTATVRSSYLLYSQLTIVNGWRYINLLIGWGADRLQKKSHTWQSNRTILSNHWQALTLIPRSTLELMHSTNVLDWSSSVGLMTLRMIRTQLIFLIYFLMVPDWNHFWSHFLRPSLSNLLIVFYSPDSWRQNLS